MKNFKNLIRLLFIVLCLGTNTPIKAQAQDSLRVLVEDGWIEKMGDKIALDISFNNNFNTFRVDPENSNTIVLYPNTPNNLRLDVNYDFISFSVQFSPDFLPGNGDEAEKGKTDSFQLGTALVFRHWFTEIAYSKVKGYYLENTFDIFPKIDTNNYIQFPDLNYWGISAISGYIFNPKFSLRSIATQTERQLKSVGSFIPVFNVDYYVVNDKSEASSTQKSNNIELNLGPGYAYTLVFQEKFYASLGVFTSIGYLNTKLTTRTMEGDFNTNQDNFVFRWDGRAGIGYNGHKFFAGLYTNVSDSSYRQENTNVINHELRINYSLFFGMRFDAPAFLVKAMNNIKSSF